MAGAAIVLLAFAAAGVAAWGQAAVAERASAAAPTMKRWGGWMLVVVGLWLAASGLFAEAFARVFPV
ncbi:MAG TPA: hypothetical protein VHL78_00385 [Actinomycetota bacterium]|nr:hypothetical protein [Actinomycetota bacterium]